jgi:precorrin-3B C17-methyltransferase
MNAPQSGQLRVVGLGPGNADWLTPEVSAALGSAEHILGYQTYLARLPPLQRATLHASDNGDEIARAEHALRLTEQGARVVVVSGGDAGIFGMAAAVFEAIEQGPPAWRALDVAVLPGITAMLAVAARLGAPLGHDFCALNLSDQRKPWPTIEQRLRLAARADFVIALYNPASRTRTEQIARAFEILREERSIKTVVALARAIGRSGEQLQVTTLGAVTTAAIDMQTLVLVGSSATRAIERATGLPWIYTPRSASEPA